MDKLAIGIDIGGTQIKGVLINEAGKILEKENIKTDDDKLGSWKVNVLELFQILKKKANSAEISVGLAAPGIANETNACITHLPNRLKGLENFIWSEYFDTLSYILNDAHAALMAESKFGVLADVKNAILITLGTGVGGGLLLDGNLYQGLFQMAGHLGHVSVNNSRNDNSILNMPGSIEYAIGNYSIEERSMGKFASTWKLLEAYNAKDEFATWMWLDMVRTLGIYISSLNNIFSPEKFALVGGITLAKEDLFVPLEKFVDLYSFKPNNQKINIVQGKFEELSGAIGAAAFSLFKTKQQ